MITDASELSMMSCKDLWLNYMEAMDAATDSVRRKDKDQALFYLAVARVTLDLHFGAVERIVDYINRCDEDDDVI